MSEESTAVEAEAVADSPEADGPETVEAEPTEGAETEVVAESTELAASAPEQLTEPLVADSVLLAARDQARAALAEITDPQMIGSDLDHEVQGAHLLTLFFESRLPGYPGWMWAATVARVDEDSAVNVLEVEMLPGEGAVVAPDWVPWSERLAQYRETQSKLAADEAVLAEAAAAELDEDDDDDSDDDDILDNDFSDFDDEIHGADVEDFEDIDDSDDDDSDDDDEGDD